jgi:UDP-N-acetylglucosamine 2-epimerase (non-hydrolysing)
MPIVFPVHPRTARRLPRRETAGVRFLPPLPYTDFLSLVHASGFVVTDSGGIQEETTFLGIPCLTLRDTTERPVTVTVGTNTLVPEAAGLLGPLRRIAAGRYKKGRVPRLWDGRAAERIADIVTGAESES